jgi:hypothetical protein
MGQVSAPYNRTESTKLPYIRISVRVEMPLLLQSFAVPLHCCTRCCKLPADFVVEGALRAEVTAQILKELHVWQVMPVQGHWTRAMGCALAVG